MKEVKTDRILYGTEAKEAYKRGVDAVANAVKVTHGAKGRNVVISKPQRMPNVTKDGSSVAKEIFLEDPYENSGAQMVKEVAVRTSAEGGDGSTTATVLAQAIIQAGYEAIGEKNNPISVKRGIDLATRETVKILKKLGRKVNKKTMLHIATVSANGDKELAKIIVDVITKVGTDGVIKIEESPTAKTFYSIEDGFDFQNGYLSPFFTNSDSKMDWTMKDVNVLLFDGYIENPEQIIGALSLFNKMDSAGTKVTNSKPVLVICEDIEAITLTSIIRTTRIGMKVCIVKAPFHGQRRSLAMLDLQSLVGGEVYTGDNISTVTEQGFGKVEKAVVTANATVLYGGQGGEAGIKKLQETLKLQIKETTDKREKTFFEERLAKLSKGIGTIYVGGFTTVEMEEKIDRVEDALNATRASVEEGYIAGEGVSYLIASKLLENFGTPTREQSIGVQIVRDALKAPFKQILRNAGIGGDLDDIIYSIQKDTYGLGIDLENGQKINLLERGIIDPLKVARVALENASSMAGTFLTIEAIVLNDETLF